MKAGTRYLLIIMLISLASPIFIIIPLQFVYIRHYVQSAAVNQAMLDYRNDRYHLYHVESQDTQAYGDIADMKPYEPVFLDWNYRYYVERYNKVMKSLLRKHLEDEKDGRYSENDSTSSAGPETDNAQH